MKKVVEHRVIDGKIVDFAYWERPKGRGEHLYKLTDATFKTNQGETIRYETLVFSGFLSTCFRPGIGITGKFFVAEVQTGEDRRGATVYALATDQNRYCKISDAISAVETMAKVASHPNAHTLTRQLITNGPIGPGLFVGISMIVGFMVLVLGGWFSVLINNIRPHTIPPGAFPGSVLFFGGMAIPSLFLFYLFILIGSGAENAQVSVMKRLLSENGFRV